MSQCNNAVALHCRALKALWTSRVLAFLFLVLASAASAAETNTAGATADLTQLPLEALMEIKVPEVFAASKYSQSASAAPSSVTVVSAEEIKLYGYQTLADVMKSVQGFHVSSDRNYDFLGVRGVNLGDFNSRVLLLVNGHRVNNSVTDGAYFDNAFILDVDLIDQVEVVRGAGSVLYGNNAFFAVINVVTRKPSDINGLEVSAEYGAFDSYKGRLTFGKSFTNGLDLLLSGTVFDSQGEDHIYAKEFDSPALNHGVADHRDSESYYSAFGSIGYAGLSLEGAFNRRAKDNPTGQYSSGDLTNGVSTYNDSRLNTVDLRTYAALKFSHNFSDLLDVSAQVYYDRSEYEIGYPLTIIGGGSVLATSYTAEQDIGEWWGAEINLKYTLFEKHVLTVGAEYKDDFRLDQSTSDGNTGAPLPGGSTSTNRQSYGVYAQADIQILTNLHLNGGVRYDQYGPYDPSVNPRLALLYQPFEKTTAKAIYGTAFRAPNFWELTYSGFQNLQPEKITSYELVLEQGIGRHWRGSLSAFRNEMENLIIFQSGTFTNFNANTDGLELAMEGSWASGLRGRASYTLQRTENRSGSLALPDSPEHLLKFNLAVPLYKDKVFAGLEVQYTSSRSSLHSTTDASGQPLTVLGETTSDYPVVNLTLFSQKLVKNLEFSASIYNLFDEQYSDPSSHFHRQDTIVQQGRSFRLKLTYKF